MKLEVWITASSLCCPCHFIRTVEITGWPLLQGELMVLGHRDWRSSIARRPRRCHCRRRDEEVDAAVSPRRRRCCLHGRRQGQQGRGWCNRRRAGDGAVHLVADQLGALIEVDQDLRAVRARGGAGAAGRVGGLTDEVVPEILRAPRAVLLASVSQRLPPRRKAVPLPLCRTVPPPARLAGALRGWPVSAVRALRALCVVR